MSLYYVAKDNIKSIRSQNKKENYLNRLNEILHDYRNRYEEIQTVLG
ncbi:MAG: hypothetical protein H8E81_03750 [Deltaproteobacteria bacterium]|nr:hypothetical protein [Deltaproteobacteria bacterium]